MNEKILDTIRSMLGPNEVYQHFDGDILVNINLAIDTLSQVGVRPDEGFIANADTTWEEYIGEYDNLEMVKTYIYLSVKTIFDPPANSFVLDSMEKKMKELEWRIDVATSQED